MRITVDLSRCQGYGNCVGAAPDVFDLGDDGFAIVLEPQPSAERADDVLLAVRMCPVQAIQVEGLPER